VPNPAVCIYGSGTILGDVLVLSGRAIVSSTKSEALPQGSRSLVEGGGEPAGGVEALSK
jgi:hypothetical protein